MATGDPIVGFPGWELQTDEYSILSNDATLSNAGWTVYDYPPDNATFPYIVIGEGTDAPIYHKSGAIHEITSNFHLYSDYKGKKEIQEAIGPLVDALAGATWSLSGFTVIQVSLDGQPPILREINDGGRVLHHGIPRVRYMIQ